MGQPGNTLLNHLGISTYWNKPLVSLNKSTVSLNLFLIFKKFIRILFKFNHVFANHLFYNALFFNKKKLLSLPVYISEVMFFKFYRIETLVNNKLNIKKNYLIRLGLKNIYFFSLKFFFLNNFFLVYFGFFKPQKYLIPDEVSRLGSNPVQCKNPAVFFLFFNFYSLLNWLGIWLLFPTYNKF